MMYLEQVMDLLNSQVTTKTVILYSVILVGIYCIFGWILKGIAKVIKNIITFSFTNTAKGVTFFVSPQTLKLISACIMVIFGLSLTGYGIGATFSRSSSKESSFKAEPSKTDFQRNVSKIVEKIQSDNSPENVRSMSDLLKEVSNNPETTEVVCRDDCLYVDRKLPGSVLGVFIFAGIGVTIISGFWLLSLLGPNRDRR